MASKSRKRTKGQQTILPFTKSVRVQEDEYVTETIENDSESPVTTSHDDAINLMETSTSTNCFL